MKFLVICADAWDRRELEVTRLKDQGLDFVYEGPGPDEDLDAFDVQAFVSDVVERYQKSGRRRRGRNARLSELHSRGRHRRVARLAGSKRLGAHRIAA